MKLIIDLRIILIVNETSSVVSLPEELPLGYFVSGFSYPLLPVVMENGIHPYSWGLVPTWVKDAETADDFRSKTLNAMGETVFEKPSFRNSIGKKRCLLPVSGFIEWRDFNKKKYPYLIKSNEDDLFSLGCIYESWVDKVTGEVRNTFSIATTAANPMMETIHNLKKRMPLIISMDDERKWIDPTIGKEEIKLMIKPFDEARMSAYTISNMANSARNDRNVPEILEPVRYPELPDL